jgi:beta-lactamase regulating signal transducer with metallopeptidase domain/biopolymer transport protein ExbD
MNPFFEYLIKSTISLSLLYLLFKAFMQNDKTLQLNRFLLLGILLFSAIIPLLNFQFFQTEVPVKQVEFIRELMSVPIFISAETPVAEPSVSQPVKSEINYWMLIYGAAMFILIIRLFVSVGKVLQLIRHAEKQKLKNIVLAVVKEMIQPFAFLNHVVLSEKDLNENKKIIVAHEQAHIKQLHAIDLAVCEVFTLLHFFNPLIWLLRRDLKLIHEYQADQAVLNNGIDAQKYQLLVLQKAVGERRFALAHHFSQKPILKRIKMMKKKKNRWTHIKLLLFAPILLLLLQAFARPELISKSEEFIPVKFQENNSEKWLEKWTMQNIGDGIFQPEMNAADSPKKQNNVLVILMNRKDQYLIENQRTEKEDLRLLIKNFLQGINPGGGKGPDFIRKEIRFLGNENVSQGFIMYQHDSNSSKEMVNYTLKVIGEAYLETRQEKARHHFGTDYFKLEKEKQEAIIELIPIWFSYEEPKTMKPPPPPPPISISLKSNGQIYVGNYEYHSFEAFEKKIMEVVSFTKEKYNKLGYQYDIIANITAESGVTEMQLNQLKNVLRESKILHVNYSSTD